MSLKAGRVGVAPDQVDNFGKVKSDVTSGYTKQEADAKFETQTYAASTYATKAEAAVLESAITDLDEDKVDNSSEDVTITFVTERVTVTANTFCKKMGKLVMANLSLNAVTVSANDLIGTLPEGSRPSESVFILFFNVDDNAVVRAFINSDGGIYIPSVLTNKNLRGSFSFLL